MYKLNKKLKQTTMKTSERLELERQAIERIMSYNYPKKLETDLCWKVIAGEIPLDTLTKKVK